MSLSGRYIFISLSINIVHTCLLKRFERWLRRYIVLNSSRSETRKYTFYHQSSRISLYQKQKNRSIGRENRSSHDMPNKSSIPSDVKRSTRGIRKPIQHQSIIIRNLILIDSDRCCLVPRLIHSNETEICKFLHCRM